MCPPTLCPDCGERRYHRGICESCGYDPQQAKRPTLEDQERLVALLRYRHADVIVWSTEEPFKHMRFAASSEDSIKSLMTDIGYDGPIFHYHPANDLFGVELWGFDLVKDQTQHLFGVSRQAAVA